MLRPALSGGGRGERGPARPSLNTMYAAVQPPVRTGMLGRAATRRRAIATATELRDRVDLAEHGLRPGGRVYRNPTTSLLYTHALRRDEGRLAEGGPLVVDTGRFTGRSPKDKFLV